MYNFLSKRFEVERANSLRQILFHFKGTRYLLVFFVSVSICVCVVIIIFMVAIVLS